MESATSAPGNKFRQASDSSFTASIPQGYEQGLVPLLFEPYARDLCERVTVLAPLRILEIAAGTGALTRELAASLTGAEIVATDLNQAMLDVAAQVMQTSNVRFAQADAAALPFDAGTFDVVVAQFGAMFFPDKTAAFREARRVLRDGGTFIFNVWDGMDDNPLDDIVCDTYKEYTGAPCFLERVPFAYFDPEQIADDLRRAGFTEIGIDTVRATTQARSAVAAFDALVNGSPLTADFERLGPERGAAIRKAIVDRLESTFGTGEFTNDMSALVVTAPLS